VTNSNTPLFYTYVRISKGNGYTADDGTAAGQSGRKCKKKKKTMNEKWMPIEKK
jgi:hypothetical protein